MSFAKVLGAVAASALLLGVGQAGASVTNLGPVGTGVPIPFSGLVGLGPFGDVFTFTLPASSGSGYSVTDFTLLNPLYQTAFSYLTLFSNADGILYNGDDTWVAQASAPGAGSLSLTYGASAGGKYYLVVGGVATGTNGGAYSGAISAAAPVPEPETYAMMLAGLCAIGFLARRRNAS